MDYKNQKRRLKVSYKEQKKKNKHAYREELSRLKVECKENIETSEEKNSRQLKKTRQNAPKLSVLEEIGNAVSHGIGAVFAVVAFLLMFKESDTATDVVAAYVYFIGLFLLFIMSCLYHSFPYDTTVKRVFRRFDHSAIYLLIGATFSPLLLSYIGGIYGLLFFIIQWVIIMTGITFVAVFGPGRLRWLHIPLYLILGWSALLFIPSMIEDDPAFFAWVLGGGIVYTLGLIPYKMKRPASHFIWHLFVIAAAVIQWIGIYIYVYLK